MRGARGGTGAARHLARDGIARLPDEAQFHAARCLDDGVRARGHGQRVAGVQEHIAAAHPGQAQAVDRAPAQGDPGAARIDAQHMGAPRGEVFVLEPGA